jgi:hypothetical protein
VSGNCPAERELHKDRFLVKVPAAGLVVDVVEEAVLRDQERVALEGSGCWKCGSMRGGEKERKRKENRHR